MLDAARVEELDLREGQSWTTDLDRRVREAEQVEKALKRAAQLLAKRARSESRLIDSLRRAGFEDHAVQIAVAEMRSLALIDDDALARDIVEEELSRRPAGRDWLEHKLRRAEVDPDAAERALNEALRSRDPEADALRLARQRAKILPHRLSDSAKARRLIGALIRRGFDAEISAQAARCALTELAAKIDGPTNG